MKQLLLIATLAVFAGPSAALAYKCDLANYDRYRTFQYRFEKECADQKKRPSQCPDYVKALDRMVNYSNYCNAAFAKQLPKKVFDIADYPQVNTKVNSTTQQFLNVIKKSGSRYLLHGKVDNVKQTVIEIIPNSVSAYSLYLFPNNCFFDTDVNQFMVLNPKDKKWYYYLPGSKNSWAILIEAINSDLVPLIEIGKNSIVIDYADRKQGIVYAVVRLSNGKELFGDPQSVIKQIYQYYIYMIGSVALSSNILNMQHNTAMNIIGNMRLDGYNYDY